MHPGLVSVTFRQLSPREIVDLVVKAGQEGIEWGGDVHVPPGDLDRAREVGWMTREAGLEVASYGSYYRLDGDGFEAVLETALALGAPHIRLWAGRMGSGEATPEMWAAAVEDGRRISQSGLDLSFEFHQGTLCDTPESTLKLLDEIGPIRCYWQPIGDRAGREAGLRALGPRISNLHVFQWDERGRRALADGEDEWRQYLAAALGDRWALLEFVADDAPEQYLRDAQTLRDWLAMPVGGEGADGQ